MMIYSHVIWCVLLLTVCNLKVASTANFTVIKVPLFLSPMVDVPRPDEYDQEIDTNLELYSKATIYDDYFYSVYELPQILDNQIRTVIFDLGVLLVRGSLTISDLKVYNCTRWCHYVDISEVTRVTGKTEAMLKGDPPITVLEMHNAVVATLEDIYCFNMSALETKLGMKSTNVTEKEWSLFVPEIIKAAIQCRADILSVNTSELAELLRENLAVLYSYGLDDLTNTFFPNFTALVNRKNEFETKSFDLVTALKSWSSAQGQAQTMLFFADDVANFNIRDLEILYRWSKPQLFAIENIPLSSYLTACSVVTSVPLFDMSKVLFGYSGTTPSCKVAYALSRSLNEIEARFNNLALIENRNALEIFINATDITSWFEMDNILQLDIDEGIWVEIPDVTHVVSAGGKTTVYTRTCSLPQVIATIKSLNQSGVLTPFLAINNPAFRNLLLATYGYSWNELVNITGKLLTQLQSLPVADLHALILDEIELRYNFTDLASAVGVTGVNSFVLSTLPTFEWYRIVRAAIERSFTVAADAVSINVAHANSGLQVVVQPDGNPSVRVSPGSVFFSPKISTDSLATCLLGRNKTDIYAMSFSEYHKLFRDNIVPVVNGKITFESQTLVSLLTNDGLTFDDIENKTVAEVVTEQTGLSLQQLGCLYGWNLDFLNLIEEITWKNVSAYRICNEYQGLTLHSILVTLSTAESKNCFGYVTLTPTSYTVSEDDGYIDVTLELVGGVVATTIQVKLSVIPITATIINDFQNVTDFTVTYNPGEIGKKTVRIIIPDDTIIEDDEQFAVVIKSLDSQTKVLTSLATITIEDDDFVSVAFQVNPSIVDENVGTVTATAVLTGEIEKNIVLSWSIKDSTTTSSDYQAVSGSSIVFVPNGPKTQSVQIFINNDNVVEGIEAFNLELSTSDSHVNTSNTPILIRDDDKLEVSFVSNAYSIVEDQGAVQLGVRAVGVLSTIVTVSLTSSNDVAIAGSDYTSVSEVVTFNPSSSAIQTINVPVTILNDIFIESSENFTASLSKGTVNPDLLTIGSPSSTTVTITDNDESTVNFKSATYSVIEGQATVTITVTNSGLLQRSGTVAYSTVAGTASTTDFTTTVGTVEFQPNGPLEKSFTIPVTNDGFVEASEQFVVILTLTDAQIVIGNQGRTTVTIIDNDVAFVEHVNTVYSFSEDVGVGVLGVQLVDLTGPLQTSITVSVKVAPVTATVTNDYTNPSPTITFNVGEFNNIRNILLPIINDTIFEIAETVLVTLDNDVDSKVSIKSPADATVTITDNDFAYIDFSQRTYNVNENEKAELELNVISGQLGTPVTITVTTSTSTAGTADFVGTSSSVTFLAGQTGPKVIEINLVDDQIAEATEFFTVSLSSSPTVTLGQAATVNILDNDAITVAFGASTYNVVEGSPTVAIQVVAIGQTTIPLSVSVTTADSSAKAGSDYTATSQVVTFNSGDTIKSVTVGVLNDQKIESVETFVVELTSLNANKINLGSVKSTVVTITDDDFATVQFSSALFNGNETSGYADIGVILTGVIENNIEVRVSTTGGTATAGLDYGTLSDYEIIFVPGEATLLYIRINVTDDSLIEGIERFSASLTSPSASTIIGTLNVTTVRLIDNDVATISFANAPSATVNEGEASALNVQMTGPLTTQVTATVIVTAGTASNTDYSVATSTVLTFGPGLPTTSIIVVTTNEDLIIENDETITAILTTSSTSVRIDDGVMTVTIKDDDRAKISLSQNSYTGREASPNVEISLNVVGQLETTVIASLSLSPNTAVSTDYQSLVNSLVSFTPGGATTQTRTITIVDDAIVENLEIFTVTATAVSSNVDIDPTTSATILIQDNDGANILFQTSSYSVTESNKRANLTVILVTATPLERPVVVSFSTLNNTAKSTDDFAEIINGQLVFNTGETNGATRQISVSINDDDIIESAETFQVKLTASSGDAIVSPGTATVTIIDNDVPSVRLLQNAINIAENGNEVTIRAILTGNLDRAVTARLRTSDSSATANLDYEPKDQVLTFTSDSPLQEITITIKEDLLVEGPEQFLVTLTSSDANVVTPGSTTVTISDNDVLTIGFASSTLSVAENNVVAVVTIGLTGTLATPVTFTVNVANVTANNYADYTYSQTEITVNPGHGQTRTITIPITNDLLVENDESFTVILTATSNLVAISNGLLTITIVDDDRAIVKFSSSSYTVRENELKVSVEVESTSGLETTVNARVTSVDSTAIAGNDYLAINNQIVSFSPGNTKQTFDISITDDQFVENTESLLLYLSTGGSSKVILGTPNATVVLIQDNDGATAQLEQNSYSVNEDQNSLEVRVRLNTVLPLERQLTFRISTENGTALYPNDFTNLQNVGTFVSGATNAATIPFSISISDDDIVENVENFFVQLSAVDTALQISNPGRATVSIVDNDVFEARFVQGDRSVNEEDPSTTISVELIGQHERNVLITLVTIPLTATATEDYTPVSTTLQFNPGDSLESVTISILDDIKVEGTETFQVYIQTADPQVKILSPERITISIVDKDKALVSFNQSNYDVPEGIGSSNVWVVLKNELQLNSTVSVVVYNFPNTAQTPADYTLSASSITLTFFGGQSQILPVSFNINDDQEVENDESFYVYVASNSNVDTATPSLSTVTIKDNDVAIVGFAKSLYLVNENQIAVVEVELANTIAISVTVSLKTNIGTASGSDFRAIAKEDITFNAQESKKTVSISLINDQVIEGNENFTVTLETTQPRVVFSRSQTTVTIQDNDALTVSFESPNYVVYENDGSVSIGIVILGSASFNLPIGITVHDGTAKIGSDYEAITGIILLSPAQTNRVINVGIIDDKNLEKNETFTVRLSNLGDSRINIGSIGITTVSIFDDDAATVQFTQSVYPVSETSSSVVVTLNLTGILDEPATVSVSSLDISANAGQDYTAITNQKITFNPNGPTTQEIAVNLTNDALLEGTESFLLAVSSSYTNIKIGQIANTTVRIFDDDVVSVGFVKDSESVNEVNLVAVVQVEISGSRSRPVTVSINSKDLSAIGGSDYSVVSNSITFQPSDTLPKTITISVSNDNKVELDETFELLLTTTDNQVTINENKMTITIIDNDIAAIRFEQVERRVNENTTSVVLGVLLTGDLGIPVSASISDSAETAVNADYAIPIGTVTFVPGGPARQEITVLIVNDEIVESTETFLVQLSPVGNKVVLGSPDKTRVYIEDNDVASVRFESSNYVIDENSRLANLTVVLVTNIPLGRDVTVRFSTESDTAVSPGDFSNIAGSDLIFKKGESGGSKIYTTVTVNDDVITESTESLKVKLTFVDSGLVPINPSTATVNIVDNDKATIFFSPTTYSIAEDKGPASLSVFLSGTIERTVSARISTVANTATAGDFSNINQIVSFSPGNPVVQSISVPIVDDAIVENAETFSVTLSEPNGVNIPSTGQTATITITDNDVVTITLEALVPSVVEGTTTNAVVLIKASGVRERSITVTVSTYDVSALAQSNDYTTTSQLLTLNPSDLQKTFIVPIEDDDIVENTEQFGVRVTSTDSQINIPTATLLISITDNDKLTLQIEQSSYSVQENTAAVIVGVTVTGSTAVTISGGQLKTEDITAKSTSDYVSKTQQLVFLPGQNVTNIPINIQNDATIEEAENFLVRLLTTNPEQIIIGAPSASTIVINDDDALAVSFERPNYIVTEGDGIVKIGVLVTGSTDLTLVAGIVAEDSSANATIDYQVISPTFQLTPGVVRHEVSVRIVDDLNLEKNETFTLLLNNLGDSRVRVAGIDKTSVLIIDDDAATVQFTQSLYTVNENSPSVNVIVNMTAGSLDEPATVRVSSVDGSAIAGQDYTAIINRELTFTPGGATIMVLQVDIENDTLLEGTESFSLQLLSNFANIKIGNIDDTTIRIIDDDVASVDFTKNSASVSESGVILQVEVVITGQRSVPVTVQIKSNDVSATRSVDYTTVDTSITFLPTEVVPRKVNIFILPDTKIESDETFSLVLTTSAPQVTVGVGVMIITITDDDVAEIRLESTSLNVPENVTSFTLGVLLTGDAAISISALVEASPETAVLGDYLLPNGDVTFSPGTKRQEVTFTVVQDNFVEATETFTATLKEIGSKVRVVSPDKTKIYIYDDDNANVRFENSSYTVNEADTMANLSVILLTTNPLQRDVTVRFSTQSDTAISPGDFSSVNSDLTFKNQWTNGTRLYVTVPVNEDFIVESTERFKAKLTTVDSGLVPVNPSTAIVTVFDNDRGNVRFVSTPYTILENDGPARINVLFSGDIARPVSVNFDTVDGTANAGSDYSSTNLLLTFNPGDNSLKTVDVTIINDGNVEGIETFTARLTNGVGVDILQSGQSTTVSIIDDDVVTVTLKIDPTTVLENANIAAVLVEATGPLQRSISLNVYTFNVTAASGGDYNAKTETITLDGTTRQRPFIVTINDDNIVENDEIFGVNITTADAQVNILEKTLYITIKDNDKLTLQLKEPSYNTQENAGTLTVTVVATGQTAVPISGSKLETDDGTAKEPLDYTKKEENFVFLPGQISKNVDIQINNDVLTEGTENFLLRLTTTNNEQITLGAQTTSLVLIQDDDVATVQFLSGQYFVNESSGFVNVAVYLTGTIGSPAIITITTQDGTAIGGNDYDALVNYQLTFGPGSSTIQYIPINITDDSLVEGSEEFTAVLTSQTALVPVGNQATTTVRILDDDVAGISFAISNLVIDENAGVTLIAVDSTGGLNAPVTVKVTVTANTASSSDYDVSPSDITLTFLPNGVTRQYFNVTPVDDLRVENDETITAILSTTDPLAVIIVREMQITIKDNDRAVARITNPTIQIKEGDANFTTVEVELIGTIDIPVTVRLTTTDEVAVVGDYNAVDMPLIFVLGNSRQSVSVSIVDDVTVEGPELFSVVLSSTDDNVIIGTPNKANVIILDNDGASLRFELPLYTTSENEKNVTLTVVLVTDTPLERTATASFSLQNGTAVSPEDFPSSIGTNIVFNVGDSSGAKKMITIPIVDDDIVEPVQTFQVGLISQENIINPGTTTVQISDNDDVTVSFSTDRYYFLENLPTAELAVSVVYTQPLQRSVVVNLVTSDNTAIAGEDYEAISTNMVILGSDGAQKTFTVPLKDDVLFEDEEGFRVHLSSTDTAVQVVLPSTANVFIIDNDDAVVRFERSVYWVNEDSGVAQICVLTSTILKDDIVVRVKTISGSAQSTLDFEDITTDITLNSTIPRCFNVVLKDDNIIEGNETFSISLETSNPRVSIPNRIALVHIVDDDVNECIDKTHDCHVNAFCTDAEESFTCTCKPGYTGDGKTCSDIDECDLNRHNCHENATCRNNEGSFHCVCNNGYTGDGVSACNDLIECDPNPNSYPCHRFSNCLDTAGSYICFCPAGYVGDGYQYCNDTNECLLGTHTCNNVSTCLNTRGSFVCKCKDGYTGIGEICTDIDECNTGMDNCDPNANCTNTMGTFECSCKDGYTGNGVSCTDINECSNSPCDQNATCNNSDGSFTCTCDNGFKGDGKTCTDIDECDGIPKPCHVNGVCNNTFGSFECTCKPGFSGVGLTSCVDIDECEINTDNCHTNATCKNNPGSFNCTCYPGFTGNGVECTNINECETNICDPNAVCNDAIGSYTCNCKTGYTGNGTYCRDIIECILTSFDWPCHQKASCEEKPGTFVCTCLSGYSGDGFQCTDINECELHLDDCHENATCTNKPGTYSCDCKSGFVGDGRDCKDFDECTENNPCNSSISDCVNIHGNFKCICKSGFILEGQFCVDRDECSDSSHNCHTNAYCTNTFGGHNCTCKSGFSGDGMTCLDVDDCKPTSSCHNDAKCENLPGNFTCSCNVGYSGDGFTCDDIDECPGSCHVNATCQNTPGAFNCECVNGLTGTGQSCDDIDECKLPGTCPNAVCTNTYASFSCTCNEGFADYGGTCKDTDECKQPNICPANSTCTNSPGLFSCDCNTGFEYSGLICTDIDECLTENECDTNANCTNTMGSYNCQCESGYAGDGKYCNDINECNSPSTYNCPDNALCTNTNGSYYCPCISGFTDDGGTCIDINECLSNPCHGNANCSNTAGTFTCTCKVGFTGNGETCIDVKDCTDPSPCDGNATCTELPGSFSCQCKSGYTGNGTYCSEINECANNPCHTNAECADLVDSHSCSCKSGYSGNGTYCTDINECSSSATNTCPANARCINDEGGFHCDCKTGFTGTTCTDIDECQSKPCDSNATCSNKAGSFTCTCKDGFTGNGTTCIDIVNCANPNTCHKNAKCTELLGSFSCQCNSGFAGNGTYCSEINECSSNPCHTSASCTDHIGNYSCSCKDGYTGNGTYCKDINECNEPNTCHTNASCTNSEGSFSCSCKTGYTGNGLNCNDIDECSLPSTNNCHTNADCKNSMGSFRCVCDKGYSGDGKTCLDINECSSLTNNCHSNATCVDTDGSYNCMCENGFTGNGMICSDVNECNKTPDVCGTPRTCENLFATFRCNCPWGKHWIDNTCKDVYVFKLDFTILKGATYSDELKNSDSDTYLKLKKDLESSVNDAYGKSAIAGSYLESRLDLVSKGDGNTIKASFKVFIDTTVKDLTTTKIGTYFNSELAERNDEKILEPKYVLSTKDDPSGFKPDPAVISSDYDECSFTPSVCQSDELMCQNYPGTYRCYCSSPRQLILSSSGSCQNVITFEGNIVILNLDFTLELADTNSLQFLQLAEQIQIQLNRYYNEVYGDDFQSTRVVGMSNGSVVVNYIARFKPGSAVQFTTMTADVIDKLPSNQTGTYLGQFQVRASSLKHTDYDECKPPINVHIQDCHKNATCNNVLSTYSCSCDNGFYGDGVSCTAKPLMQDPNPPKDDMWWLVYAIVFGVAFLIIFGFILIVCCLENLDENRNRYRVDDTELVGGKNKYFFNTESIGIVNQNVELSPRHEDRDIYTTPARMESYKVNPMFNESKGSQYDGEMKSTLTNGPEAYIAL